MEQGQKNLSTAERAAAFAHTIGKVYAFLRQMWRHAVGSLRQVHLAQERLETRIVLEISHERVTFDEVQVFILH